MSFTPTHQTPNDPQHMPPARRRRAGRLLLPLDASERETVLDGLAQRASPAFDFFLFSLISGAIIGVGIFLDSPALLVLGALVAPLMVPAVGVALGTVTGSMRYFSRSLLSLVIAALLVFSAGWLSGFVSRFWVIEMPIQAYVHARLFGDDFLVLALGTIMTTIWLVKNRRNALVASVAIAFELYVPLGVAGFGLGSGLPHLFPDGLVVFALHLAWSALLGALTLAILGFRPLTIFGYTLGGAVSLVGIILLIGLSGAGAVYSGQVALPTPLPTQTFTVTPSFTPSPSVTVTPSPVPPSATPAPTATATITPSPSFTPSPTPTPVYALVNTPPEYGGAILRSEPGFSNPYVTSVSNGTLIEILSAVPVEAENALWHHVRLVDGREGWMLQSAMLVATPAPNW